MIIVIIARIAEILTNIFFTVHPYLIDLVYLL